MRDRALDALHVCPDTLQEIDAWAAEFTGRRSAFGRCAHVLGTVPMPEQVEVARELKAARDTVARAYTDRRSQLDARPAAGKGALEPIGALLAGSGPGGGRHPVQELISEAVQHFATIGFSLHESSQLKDVEHSFDLLSVPAKHPTRSPAHTFYAEDDIVLRSHTTSSVLRLLARHSGIRSQRFVIVGACHRSTVPSARFVTEFHQMEAAVTGPQLRMSDVKGLAVTFAAAVLGDDADVRIRYKAFPYVLPGLAVDVTCSTCRARGCSLCRGSE
ncbi:tRNA ligase subunit PheS family protein [Streptomyces sp. NPDC002285]